MSQVIDEKVVELRFDNKQFESGVQSSINSINNLNNSLKLDDGVQEFKMKFSAMRVVAMTALSEITKSAMQVGKSIYNSIFGQIKAGGMSRASKIEAAKFQLEGLKVAWKDIEDDINYGVADTAYGLDAAATAASQLVASGVKFGKQSDQMKNTLRAISGVAAMTNSTYEDTARIFTTVAGQGRLMTMQLRQLEGRGLNAAAQLGEVLGKTEAEIRDMVTKGQIDFATFANAMDEAFGEHAKAANRTLTGVLSNIRSALSKIGADFYSPIIETDGALVKMLDKIRLILNLVRKDIKPTTEKVAKAINTEITKIENLLKKTFLKDIVSYTKDGEKKIETVLSDSAKKYLQSLTNLFASFGKLVKSYVYPVIDGFKKAFNGSALNGLTSFNNGLASLMQHLTLSARGMIDLRDTMQGIFSVIKLVSDIIVELAKAISPMFGDVKNLAEVVLRLTGFVGRLLTSIVNTIRESKAIQTIIKVIGQALGFVASAIVMVVENIANFIERASKLKVVQDVLNGIAYAINKVVLVLGGLIGSTVQTLFNLIVKVLEKIDYFYVNYVKGHNIAEILVNIGKGIAYCVASLLGLTKNKSIDQFFKDFGASIKGLADKLITFAQSIDLAKIKMVAASLIGVVIGLQTIKMFKSITKTFDSLTGLINSKKTKTLMKLPSIIVQVAASIAILAGSMYLLSKINPEQLKAQFIMVGSLLGGLTLLASTLSNTKTLFGAGFNSVATGILEISGAVLLLSQAMVILNDMKIDLGMSVRIAVISALMIEVITLSKLMIANGADILKAISTTLVLISFAEAMRGIAAAFSEIASLSPNDAVKACEAMGVLVISIAGIVIAAKGVGLFSGLGLFLFVKVFKTLLPELIELYKQIDFNMLVTKFEQHKETLLKIAAIATVATMIAGLCGKGLLSFSIGLIILTKGVDSMVKLTKKLAEVDWKQLGPGIVGMKKLLSMVALMMVASAFTAKSKTFSFSLALLVIVGAMNLLVSLAERCASIDSKGFDKGIVAVDSILVLIGGLMVCTKYLKTGKDINKTLFELAGIVAIIGLILYGLTKLDPSGALQASIGLSTTLLSFCVMCKQLSKFKIKQDEFVELLKMTVILGLVAGSLALLSFQPWENIVASGVAMSAALLSFTKTCKVVSSSKGIHPEKIATVLELSILMAVVAKSLAVLSFFPWPNIAASGIAMGAALLGFSTVVKAVSGFKINPNEILNVAMVAAVMGIIAVELMLLSDYPWQNMASAGLAMSATLIAFGYAIKSTKEMLIDPGVLSILFGVVAMMGIIALELSLLANYPWSNLLAAGTAMGLTLVAFAGSFVLVSKALTSLELNTKDIVALSIMAGMYVIIGGELLALSGISWGKLLATSTIMAASIIGYALAFKMVSDTLGKTAINVLGITMMAIMAGTIFVVATELQLLSLIPWSNLLVATVGMTGVMLAFGFAMTAVAKAGENTLSAIISLSLMVIAATSMLTVGTKLQSLSQIKWDKVLSGLMLAMGVMAAMLALSTLISGFVAGDIGGIIIFAGVVLALGAAFNFAIEPINKFAAAMVLLGSAPLLEVAVGLAAIGASGIALIAGFLGFVLCGGAISKMSGPLIDYANAMGIAKGAINDLMLTDLPGITQKYAQFGVDIVAGVSSGMTNALPMLQQELGKTTQMIGASIAQMMNQTQSFDQIGYYMDLGLANGIQTNSGLITQAIEAVANSALERFRSIMGIHSPSTEMYDCGDYMVQGLSNGVNEQSNIVNQAMSNMAIGAVSSYVDGYNKAVAAIEPNPPIPSVEKTEAVLGDTKVAISAGMQEILDTYDITTEDGLAKATQAIMANTANAADDMSYRAQASARETFDVIQTSAQTTNADLQLLAQYAKESGDAQYEAMKKASGAFNEEIEFTERYIAAEEKAIEKENAWNECFTIQGMLMGGLNDAMSGLTNGLNATTYSMDDLALSSMNAFGTWEQGAKNSERILNRMGEYRKQAKLTGKTLEEVTKDTYVFRIAFKEEDLKITANTAINQVMDHVPEQYRQAVVKNIVGNIKTAENALDSLPTIDDVLTEDNDPTTSAGKQVESLNEKLEKSIKLFDAVGKQSKITASELITNMSGQIAAVEQWSANIAKLAAKGFSAEFVKELADEGTGNAATVEALLSMNDAQVAYTQRMYDRKKTVAQEAANRIEKVEEDSVKVTNDTHKKGLIEYVAQTQLANKQVISIMDGANGEMIGILSKSGEITAKVTREQYHSMINDALAADSTLLGKFEKSYDKFLNNTQKSTNDTKKVVSQAILEYANDISKLTEAESLNSAEVEKWSRELLRTNPGLEKMGVSAEKVSDTVIELSANISKTREALAKNIRSSIDLFSEWGAKYETTADDILEKMHSQMNGVALWSAQLSELAGRGISDGFLQYLTNLGPKGAEEVNAIASMTAEQLAEANDVFAQYMALPDQTAKDLTDSFVENGQMFTAGFMEGLMEGQNTIAEGTAQLGQTALDSMRAILQIHSPSQETYNDGCYFVEGFKNAIRDTTSSVVTRAKILASKTVVGFTTYINRAKGIEIANNIVDGLIIGLNRRINEVRAAAEALSRAAYTAAQAGVDAHSPSRKFIELGGYCAEGLAIGLTQMKGLATAAAEEMASEVVNTSSSIMDIIDWDADPVIKPRLDLSEVEAGAGRINEMFNQRAIKANETSTPNQNEVNLPTNGNINFVQNNYSPKALSRIEIYRQTKNQISAMKGATAR